MPAAKQSAKFYNSVSKETPTGNMTPSIDATVSNSNVSNAKVSGQTYASLVQLGSVLASIVPIFGAVFWLLSIDLEPLQRLIGFIGLTILAIGISRAINVVPEGENWTILRLGKHIKDIGPGFHLIAPFFDRIGDKANMKSQFTDMDPQEIITSDNASVMADGVIYYHIKVAGAACHRVTNVDASIKKLGMSSLRAILGSMDLDDIFANRIQISEQVADAVRSSSEVWGVEIERVELNEILPHKDLKKHMLEQTGSERRRRAKELEAKSAERLAEAEALRAEMLLNALAKHPPDVRADYLGLEGTISYRSVAQQAKTVMVPTDGGSVASTIKVTEAAQQCIDPVTPSIADAAGEENFVKGLSTNLGTNGSQPYVNGSATHVAAE